MKDNRHALFKYYFVRRKFGIVRKQVETTICPVLNVLLTHNHLVIWEDAAIFVSCRGLIWYSKNKFQHEDTCFNEKLNVYKKCSKLNNLLTSFKIGVIYIISIKHIFKPLDLEILKVNTEFRILISHFLNNINIFNVFIHACKWIDRITIRLIY